MLQLRGFGFLMPQPRQPFSLGKQLEVRSSHLTSLKGWQLSNRCFQCECDEETVHHILLHCSIARSLWISFSLLLASNGCSLDQLRRRSLARRGLLRAKKREKLGVQSHYVFFGLFGGKEIALCLEKGAYMFRD